MNIFFGIICLLFTSHPSTGLSDITEIFSYREGDRFFLINDANGNLKLVDAPKRFDAEKDVTFLLYTRKNPEIYQTITLNDAESLTKSNYDHSKPTKMFVHGWTGNGEDRGSRTTRRAFLEAFDANVFTIDWAIGADALYPTSCAYVPQVGAMMARMIDWLVSLGSKLDDFHVTGYSLGGHVVGCAGRAVTSGKVPYITSLDPAMPLWGSDSQRVRPGDAVYVEAIHTNMNGLGLKTAVGHNDFYPNGGSVQPGCGVVDLNCSHDRAYQYFSASLDNQKFMAQQCRDIDEITDGRCSNISQLHLGGGRPKQARGLFYLTTNAEPPYYQE